MLACLKHGHKMLTDVGGRVIFRRVQSSMLICISLLFLKLVVILIDDVNPSQLGEAQSSGATSTKSNFDKKL